MKEVLLWAQCCQTALHATNKSFVKGRGNQFGKLYCSLTIKLLQPESRVTKRNVHVHVQSSIIHNNQKTEAHVYQNVVHTYSEILLNLKKEKLSHAETWINIEDVTLRDKLSPKKTNTVLIVVTNMKYLE